MPSLDQRRSLLAFDHVTAVKGLAAGEQSKYASVVFALPALIRSAGLSQALHFVASRKDPSQRRILEHVAAQFSRLGIFTDKSATAEALLSHVRSAELSLYLRMTNEALAVTTWYTRFVQGVLKIDPSEAGDDLH